jgi:hypothetical protein
LVAAADVEHDPVAEGLVHAGAVAGLVEGVGGFGVGVVVEEPVEEGERFGMGLSCLPTGGRDGNREGGGLAAAEADVKADLVGFGDRDVLDEEAGLSIPPLDGHLV